MSAVEAKAKAPRAETRETARLLTLGALAASAGVTAAQLKRIGEARRLRALAIEMRAEGAALGAWARDGADPASVPRPSPALDAWQAEFGGAELAKA